MFLFSEGEEVKCVHSILPGAEVLTLIFSVSFILQYFIRMSQSSIILVIEVLQALRMLFLLSLYL